MRRVICVEEALFKDVYLTKGSMRIPEQPIAVKLSLDETIKPIGKAFDFVREDSGEITAEISFFLKETAGIWENVPYEISSSIHNMLAKTYDGVQVVSKFEIGLLVLHPK